MQSDQVTMKYSILQVCIVLLVVIVVVLQVVHFTLFSWLDGRKRTGTRSFRNKQINRISPSHNKSFTLPQFKLDTSGSYQIYYNVESIHIKSNFVKKNLEVTMVTQCTPSNLLLLPRMTEAWQGPVSVAVFTRFNKFFDTLSAILNLIKCNQLLRKYTSFHIVHPLVDRTTMKTSYPWQYNEVKCGAELENFIRTNFQGNNFALSGTPYPINLLRNVGRLASESQFFMVLDVDMLPSKHLRKQFLHFYNSKTKEDNDAGGANSVYFEENVFILPSFEIKEDSSIPVIKSEIIKMIETGDARQFYFEVCSYCHGNTDYSQWQSYKSLFPEEVNVAYSVMFHQKWEPFYISHKNVPYYDERFKQYGYNRISQVCETYLAGFSFQVLDNAFVIHQGFKYPSKFHSQKDEENRKNYHLFLKFAENLKTKYPDQQRGCLDIG